MVKSDKTLGDFVGSKPTFSVNNKKELSEDIQLEVNSIMKEKSSLEDKLDKLRGLTKRLTAGDYEKHEEYMMAEEIIHSSLLYYGINPPSEEKNKEQKEMLSSLDILLRKQIDLIQEMGSHKNLNTVSVLEDSLDAPIREFINPLNDREGLFNVIFGEGWKGMLRFGIYNPENKLEYQAKTPEKELTSYARIKARLFTGIGLGLVGVYSLFSYIENKTGNAGLGMTAGGLAAGGLGTILYYYYLKCEEYKKKFIEKNNDLKDHGGYKLLAKLNEFKSNPPDIEVISKKYNSSFKSYLRSKIGKYAAGALTLLGSLLIYAEYKTGNKIPLNLDEISSGLGTMAFCYFNLKHVSDEKKFIKENDEVIEYGGYKGLSENNQ